MILNESFPNAEFILNELPMGVTIVGLDGKIEMVNSYFTRLTGYGLDDIQSLDTWFLLAYPDPDYRSRVLRAWEMDSQTNSSQRIFDVTCKDGSVKTISFTARFSGYNKALITLTDVTSQKTVQERVKKNEKTLKSIFMAAPTGIGMVVDRVFVSVNEKLCRMTGYTEEELIGRKSTLLYPTTKEFEYVGSEKYKQIKENGTGTVETRWKCKDGRIIHVLLSSTPVNQNDWSEGVTFTALDITEQKKLETALKDSEIRYRGFFDEILSGAFITKPDGTLLDCNQEFQKVFGFESKTAAMRVNVSDLYQKPDSRQKFIHQLKTQKGVKRYESRMKKIDGSPIQIMENAMGVFDETGELIFIRGFLSDITETKKMETQLRQAQKMEAIGTLVGGISHDFNNLIQAIGGYTELLQMDKGKDHPDFANIQALRRISKRAGDLVQQLLVFSREAESKKKVISLNDEIYQVYNLLEKTIPRMIAIEMDLLDDLWSVLADPLQIEQVLLNLGSNAADAMPDGGIITLTSRNVELDSASMDPSLGLTPGKYVRLAVKDNGFGMHKTVMDRIFDPFFTTKKIGKGTGLGLSSVYGIVKSHEGTITCDSEVGRGSCFSIYLPVTKAKPVEKRKKDRGGFKEGKETILLVDDEKDILEITSHAFRQMGYTFVEADSGEQALEIYKGHGEKIDLVILDLSMPGMGGYKCLEYLLDIDPEIKILVATGYSADATINECLSKGAVGYIQKPYRLANLFSYVRTILDETV